MSLSSLLFSYFFLEDSSLIFNIHIKIGGKSSCFATRLFKNIEIITFLAEFLLLSVLQKSLFHYGKKICLQESPHHSTGIVYIRIKEKNNTFLGVLQSTTA